MRFHARSCSYFEGLHFTQHPGVKWPHRRTLENIYFQKSYLQKHLKNIHTNKKETNFIFTKSETSGANNISITATFSLRLPLYPGFPYLLLCRACPCRLAKTSLSFTHSGIRRRRVGCWEAVQVPIQCFPTVDIRPHRGARAAVELLLTQRWTEMFSEPDCFSSWASKASNVCCISYWISSSCSRSELRFLEQIMTSL
jgi:hypothetical protein